MTEPEPPACPLCGGVVDYAGECPSGHRLREIGPAGPLVIVRRRSYGRRDTYHSDPDCRHVGRMDNPRTIQLAEVEDRLKLCRECSGEARTGDTAKFGRPNYLERLRRARGEES